MGPGSGWTTHVSPTARRSIYRTPLASAVRGGRPDVVYGLLRTSSGSAVRYQYVRLQYRYYGSGTWHNASAQAFSTGRVAAACSRGGGCTTGGCTRARLLRQRR